LILESKTQFENQTKGKTFNPFYVTKSKGLNDQQASYMFQASNKPKTHAQLKYFVVGQSLFESLPKKQVQLDHPPAPTHLKHFISTTHNPSPTLASRARCE
jgi:hypothetical protein